MKFYLISDNTDTRTGMRLAGIDGVVVHEQAETEQAIDEAAADKEVAVILITEKLVKLCGKKVYDMKLNLPKPLIVEIPDRHGTSQITDTINRYISEAIGLKIDK